MIQTANREKKQEKNYSTTNQEEDINAALLDFTILSVYELRQ